MMREIILGPKDAGLGRYTTGLWSADDGDRERAFHRGRGWAIGLRIYQYEGPEPFEEQERLRERIGVWPPTEVHERIADGSFRWQSAPEILIYASSRDSAQRAANLLFAAMLLIDGQSLVHENLVALPEDEAELAQLHPLEVHRDVSYSCQPNVTVAAALAAKLSRKKRWRYAAMKYWISHRICSVPWMDTHPHRGRIFRVELDPANHVVFAQAIIAAYSTIEELEFEVRASNEKPSMIDGQWNPIVRQDLENRLQCPSGDFVSRTNRLAGVPS